MHTSDALPDLYHVLRRDLGATVDSHRFGEGRRLAIIDSGVASGHLELNDRSIQSCDFTDSVHGAEDALGHGTAVATIMAGRFCGIASRAELLSFRVVGDNGRSELAWIEAALEAALDLHPDVVNMSIGSLTGSAKLLKLCKLAYKYGIPVVAATTYDARGRMCCPARYDSVISVGAVDRNDTRMYLGRQDKSPDRWEYGDEIVCGSIDGGYCTMSGTSAAAAQVSAMLALRMAYR